MSDLLTQFADPQTMENLSMSSKLTAGLVTTVLGMGITFTALIVLLFIIGWMEKLNRKKPLVVQDKPVAPGHPVTPAETVADPTADEELIAVITATIAQAMHTSTQRIVIRNLERIENTSPAWNRAGLIEQMNSRL